MQELQNWFRIFCHSNGALSPPLPTQPEAEPVRGLRGQSCELKTVRVTKKSEISFEVLA